MSRRRIVKVCFLLCLAIALWTPWLAGAQPAVPEGWKTLPAAPHRHGAERACSGRTGTKWQVRFEGGQLRAEAVERYDPYRPRDELPYPIDFTGALGPPVPPPPGSRAAEERYVQSWPLIYARDYAGRKVVPTRDGWLVGFNAGEFGGSLWWYPRSPGSGMKLSDRNVQAIIGEPNGRSFIVLIGLAHMGDADGAVLTVGEDPGGGWRSVRQVNLRGTPDLHARDARGLLIVTTGSIERLSDAGELELLSEVDYPSGPYSIALGSNGEIAVGLRFFVHVLVPASSGYRHHWFIPTKCTRFKDEKMGCICKGGK